MHTYSFSQRLISFVTLVSFTLASVQIGYFSAWADVPVKTGMPGLPLSLAERLQLPVTTPSEVAEPLPDLLRRPAASRPTAERFQLAKEMPAAAPQAEASLRMAKTVPDSARKSDLDTSLDTILAKAYSVRSSKDSNKPGAIRIYRPAGQNQVQENAAPATTEKSEAAGATGIGEGEGQSADTPESLLAEGDALLQAGRLREAALVYFEIVNDWPDTAASAALDNVVNALSWDVERSGVDLNEMRLFTDQLPEYAACKSDKAVYWLAAAQQITGEALHKAGNDVEAASYLTRGRDVAWAAMQEMPGSAYQIFFPGHYIRSCRFLGREELSRGMTELKQVVRQQPSNNVLKFSARMTLAITHHTEFDDIIEGSLQCMNVRDEFPGSEVDVYLTLQR